MGQRFWRLFELKTLWVLFELKSLFLDDGANGGVRKEGEDGRSELRSMVV